jgi:hypothetical protein
MDDSYNTYLRQVIIGREEDVKDGTIELPREFYETTGIRPGHHVIIQHGDQRVKAKAKFSELLKREEVGVSPGMATLMGLENGMVINVVDKITFAEKVFDEVEDVKDVMESRIERTKEYLTEDMPEAAEKRREKVLDKVIPSRTEEPPPKAIDVEPDLSHIADTPETPVQDISEQVEVWNPDPEGDGVKEYKPGGDEEDEE